MAVVARLHEVWCCFDRYQSFLPVVFSFFFNDTDTPDLHSLPPHDALPLSQTRTHTRTDTCTPHTHTHTHVGTLTHIHTCTPRTFTHAHLTHVHTYPRSHMHTSHTYTCAHTNIHTSTPHMQTYTHAPIVIPRSKGVWGFSVEKLSCSL